VFAVEHRDYADCVDVTLSGGVVSSITSTSSGIGESVLHQILPRAGQLVAARMGAFYEKMTQIGLRIREKHMVNAFHTNRSIWSGAMIWRLRQWPPVSPLSSVPPITRLTIYRRACESAESRFLLRYRSRALMASALRSARQL
jgi:hypothetical protein